MGRKKYDNNKNKQNENKKPDTAQDQTQPTDVSKVQVKPNVEAEKTQTELQTQPKIEQPSNDIKANESNAISEDLKVEPSKNIELPIDSKIGQSNIEAPQQQVNHQEVQQPETPQQDVQIPAKQAEQALLQAEVQVARNELPQHITQPLQVIEERSGENLISNNTASFEREQAIPEDSTGNLTQSKVEEHGTQVTNNVESEKPNNQVIDTLPVQSQHVENNEVQNEVEKVAQIPQHAKEVDVESLPQRQLEVVPQNEHKAVSQKNLDALLQKHHEKELVVPKDLNNTESFFSIQGEQQRERQYRQAFPNNTEAKIQQRSEEQETFLQRRAETEKIEPQITTNEIVDQIQNQVSENKEVSKDQQLGNNQVIIEQSADNIQILQQSAPYHLQGQKLIIPQTKVYSDPICITESIDVQKLLESQERPLQTQTQASKVEVKPQVVEVYDGNNNVLDINQPIQLVQPVPLQQIVAQKIQNNIVAQKVVDPSDNRIFILVQSEEIPAAEGDKEINVQVSTQIAPAQINVKDSLSFSDLNFSVERSAGKESISGNYETEQKQQIKIVEQYTENKVPEPQPQVQQNTENKVPEAQPQALVNEVIVQEIIQPIKSIEVHYTNLNQPLQPFDEPPSRTVEVLVQQKVEAPIVPQVPLVPQVAAQVRLEPPSEVISILVQNTTDIAIKTDNIEILKESESIIQQKQGESNVQQRQDLSTSNKEAIVQEARISEENKQRQIIHPQVILNPVDYEYLANQKIEKRQEPNKNPSNSTLMEKIVISSSTILAGGIAWALTKSTHKSILFGVLGLSAGIATTQLLK